MTNVFLGRAHDVENPGARTADGLSEWEIAEKINEEAHAILKKSGIKAVRLEKTLQDRIDGINEFLGHATSPTIAVETHCNWSPVPTQSGFFAIAYAGSPAANALASSIITELWRVLIGVRNLGVNQVDGRRRWIRTPKEHAGKRLGFIMDVGCPSVIIECCYLSNPTEAAWITAEDNRRVIGDAVGRGILGYLKSEATADGNDNRA